MRLLRVVALLAFTLLAAAPAQALPGAHISASEYVEPAEYPGTQHLHYEFGPVRIKPGQNNIELALNRLKPSVPGYITRFKPDLVYASDHTVPKVDVIHLHHGVWLIDGYPTFAAGEEKTIVSFPRGYGFHHDPDDAWVMNHMIHNLYPDPTSVYITYDIDFVPDSEPAAADITPVHPLWMDVAGIKAYPVFDALRGQGAKGTYTFPADAGRQRAKVGFAQRWTAPKDITLVSVAGHLHPGGLYNDLDASRGGVTKPLFRSEAKYFEPAGAVSWDVSMTASPPDWRVAVKQGDTLSTSVAYDVRKASWYESMGIMVAFYADGIRPDAVDPFTADVPTRGLLTHGHLDENRNHGGQALGLPNPMGILTGARTSNVDIEDFVYGRGDLRLTGLKGRLPTVRPGQRLKFTNLDALASASAADSIYHTVTACRAPCNRAAGIAYPLANAPAAVSFDSGELGYGPSIGAMQVTAAAQRNTWKTPKSLPTGTYTYFCRVHPFMRGAFRVSKRKQA